MQSRKSNVGVFVLAGAALMAFGVGIVAVFNGIAAGNAPAGGPKFDVTLYPQATLPPALPSPVAAVTTTASAPPAPATQQYTVQPNDTMWDIAVKFGLSLDQIIAANPGINPDRLALGQTLTIPSASFAAPPRPTSDAPAPQASNNTNTTLGFVLSDAGGVRLREQPSTDSTIITKLGPNTQLQILGEVAGKTWLQVITPNGTQGYIMAQYVAMGGATVLPTQASGDVIAAPTAIPVGPLEYPFLSDLSGRVYQIFRAGQARGNRANAFSVIGDSNTQHPAFLKPVDWGNYNLGGYTYLQSTVDYFKGSFGRDSAAAFGGFNTRKALDPAEAPASCGGQSAVACELNAARPSVVFILLGTGDHFGNGPDAWQNFEGRYRQIIEIAIGQGVIPVLITKADDLEFKEGAAPYNAINAKVAQLASEYQVPLLNLRQVVETLPNRGCTDDGFHYNFPAGDRSAWFTPEYLQYGYNQRNLTTLQTLDVIRRKVMQAG